MFDVAKIRKDFPILQREVYGRPLVYLDNAATTQKPLCVLQAMQDEYLNQNANVHRGVHYLSQRATELHEEARDTVQHFLGAAHREEIVFTRGTTEAINLVATTFCESQMKAGDEVIVTEMEHHSNIVPWQLAERRHGIKVKVWPITDDGRLATDLATLITPRTRLIAVTHVSNVLGTVNPIADIVATAHAHNIPVLVDAAQSAPHIRIDVQQMDCDFLCLSGHKMYGPTGIGVLYGKLQWLDRLPPYQGGGEMIERVSLTRGTTFERPPLRFEAGTPDYIATHGLATAIRYMEQTGMEAIAAYEHDLTQYALNRLTQMEGIRLFGLPTTTPVPPRDAATPRPAHTGVLSFLVGDIHPLDMGTLLDRLGIAVRTGHHCAQPLMERLGITGTVRASLALYNTREEIDALCDAISRVARMF